MLDCEVSISAFENVGTLLGLQSYLCFIIVQVMRSSIEYIFRRRAIRVLDGGYLRFWAVIVLYICFAYL